MKGLPVLIFAVLIFSCRPSVPPGVLPPEKMQSVLWDVLQADEMADYYAEKDSTFRTLSRHADYYQKIFTLHKITRQDFKKSLDYYQDHPERLKTILDSLQHYGERMQKADSLHRPAPAKADSLPRKPPFPAKHH